MNLNQLDKEFSIFIRNRDRIKGTEYIKCISCGKIVHWKESDCGHYINRKHMSTRYNEKNCHAQCRACNRFDEGNMSGYTLGLIEKYGNDFVRHLYFEKNKTVKFSETEIKEMTKHYKKLNNDILNN